jgi:hypothetical protein
MNTNKSGGLALVPQKFPPEGALGAFVEDPALTQVIGTVDDTRWRTILWSLALQNAFTEQQWGLKVPGFRFASIGFADPEREQDAFGIMVYTQAWKNKEDRLSFDLGGIGFPVFVRPSFEELHGPPQVHPSDGTAACWAKSRKAGFGHKVALLTAKHVVEGIAPGGPVRTTHGQGKLLDLAPASIDAALVVPPASVTPNLGGRLETLRYVAQWSDVQFTGMGSKKAVKTKVTEVWFRDINHPSIPARIFLAWPGEKGDSGALVVDTNGKGIGIYLGGQVNIATNRMEGFCQHLDQAANLLECDLYH